MGNNRALLNNVVIRMMVGNLVRFQKGSGVH